MGGRHFIAAHCCACLVSACLLGAPASAQTRSDAQPTMEIYGFTEADPIADLKQNDPEWFDTNRPTKLPASANEFGQDGRFYFSPRHSRFGVKATLPASSGEVHTTFEFDLVGVGRKAGQTAFRLRHAWGQWKKIGAGHTFSQFMDPDVYPNRLDFWGPNGMTTTRTPQVFWQPYQEGESNLRIAAENPGATADGEAFATHIALSNVAVHLPMPDITKHYRQAESWGYVQLGGTIRYIGYDDLPNDVFDLGGHVWGWGVSVSSNVRPDSNDVFRLQAVYGHGIENDINDAPIDVGPQFNPGIPLTPIVGEALPVLGIVAYFDHSWTDTWSTTAGYSRVDVSNSNAQVPAAFHIGQYATANLRYTPLPNVLIGGEFQWARRTNFSDGFSVNDFRVEFSFKYSFSYTLQSGS
jgi:hypothetical protein